MSFFLILFVTQIVGSFLATSPVTGFTRSAVFLAAFPLITALVCLPRRCRTRHSLWIVPAATLAALASIYGLRHRFDRNLFLGAAPPQLELPGYTLLSLLTLACAGAAVCAFSVTGVLRKFRWAVVGAITVALVGLAVLARNSVWELSPSHLLQTIDRLERAGEADPGNRQQLSVMLATSGRETDAEAASGWEVIGGTAKAASQHSPRLDLSRFRPLPWRETMRKIAHRERLIILMEAHNSPKHRQWIEQVLPVLREAGFRDFAAEGLGESPQSLRQRGYPVSSTGFYASDPHYGNVLRTALALGFELHGYEAFGKNYRDREREQAANLAKLLAENPKLKLVVHAGYGHVFKKPLQPGEKMMAAYLWDLTGIEPYCILQTWHSPEDDEARQLAALAGGKPPVMLVPAPAGLSDPQFQYPKGAVDALVIHAPSVGGPAERVHEFRSERRRVAGTWNGAEWPVLIGAFKKGESPDAVALDQVMLRAGERKFVLWVPNSGYEVRAFGMKGRIRLVPTASSPALRLEAG